jgi:hypothetical protein
MDMKDWNCKKCGGNQWRYCTCQKESVSAELTGYVQAGFIVAEPYEEFYPRFFKMKDHFGAARMKLEADEKGFEDVMILPVYIKKST